MHKSIKQLEVVCANSSASVLYSQRLQPLSTDHLKTQVCTSYSTVALKDNVALAHVLTLAHSQPIVRITWVTCSRFCQFKCFSAPCQKGTTIEHRAHEHFNPCNLLQVIQSTWNDTWLIETIEYDVFLEQYCTLLIQLTHYMLRSNASKMQHHLWAVLYYVTWAMYNSQSYVHTCRVILHTYAAQVTNQRFANVYLS